MNAALRAVGKRLEEQLPSKYELNKYLHAIPVSGFARLEKEQQAMMVGLFFGILRLTSNCKRRMPHDAVLN